MATINVDKPPIVKRKDLHAYLSRWQWPNQFASGAKVCETGGFQATASQTMSSAPVFAFFFREVILPQGRHTDAVRSFLLCCTVLELLVGAARGHAAIDELAAAMNEHLQKHVDVYGIEWWAFKHHMANDAP